MTMKDSLEEFESKTFHKIPEKYHAAMRESFRAGYVHAMHDISLFISKEVK